MRRFFLHPSDRALAEFAEPGDTTSPSVRAPLASCSGAVRRLLFIASSTRLPGRSRWPIRR